MLGERHASVALVLPAVGFVATAISLAVTAGHFATAIGVAMATALVGVVYRGHLAVCPS